MRTKVFRAGQFLAIALIFPFGPAEAGGDTPATGPARDDGSLRYEVVAVEGRVRIGPDADESLRTDGPAWFTPKVGDLLGAGLQIRVPLRSTIKLVGRPAEPPTVILIERSSVVSIADLSLKNGVATSRIKLAYGAIRAGVMEGGTRSDMEIESPVATLSKKGTDIFRFEYHNGRYMMSLSEQGRGLLQAIQNQATGYGRGGVPRFVTAGQFVTHQLVRAIDNLQFERNININDQFGLGGADQLFTMLNNRGFAFLLPPGNSPSGLLDQPVQGEPGGGVGGFNPQNNAGNVLTNAIRSMAHQPNGDFGVGQGPLPPFADPRLARRQASPGVVLRESLRKAITGNR